VSLQALHTIRDLIQEDIGQRGLRADPVHNLINACPDDFAGACRSLAEHPQPAVAIVTGFYIPHAQPPATETDGPLGAVFLARALVALGVPVVLVTDASCQPALQVGLQAASLEKVVQVLVLPGKAEHWPQFLQAGWRTFAGRFRLTHLVALERCGPSHSLESLQAQAGATAALGETYLDFLHEVPEEDQDRPHNMAGRDIAAHTSPAHLLFEVAATMPGVQTFGIGDGGNEIGMGKIPWEVIRRNIPNGGRIACRIATDYLIVCGISNWGAYGLATGVYLLRGRQPPADLFAVERERQLLQQMVEHGPLVDGRLGKQSVTVDGVTFERYAEPLRQMAALLATWSTENPR
jgi:hypothetical protein